MEKEPYYYQAGAALTDSVYWGTKTHRSARAAEQEARRLAREHGGAPAVCYWRRDWGMRPRCADAVAGAYVVGEEESA
jgi:hypothetical protein